MGVREREKLRMTLICDLSHLKVLFTELEKQRRERIRVLAGHNSCWRRRTGWWKIKSFILNTIEISVKFLGHPNSEWVRVQDFFLDFTNPCTYLLGIAMAFIHSCLECWGGVNTRQADSCETTLWVVLAEAVSVWGEEGQSMQWNDPVCISLTNDQRSELWDGGEGERESI